MRRPSNLCPHLVYNTIAEIPFSKLREAGYTHVVFDKDNTLTEHDSASIRADLLPALNDCIALFGDQNVGVLSNNQASNVNHRVKVLKGEKLKKPFCKEELLSMLKTDGTRVVVVGDRLATDMLLGHLLDGVSVLVLPWKTDNEQAGIKVARTIEQFVWSSLLGCRLKPHKNEVINHLQVSTRFP